MRIDESTGEPVRHLIEKPADPRLALDDLLKQAAALISREKVLAASRALNEESEAIRARRMRLAQAQAERFEWKPVASLAMFETQTCECCGSAATLFRGFGTLFQQKASFVQRIAAAPCLDHGLPFQKKILEAKAPFCSLCIEQHARAEPYQGTPSTFVPDRKTDDGPT